MEDVLDIYELSYNPDIPVVCMNEKPYQLLGKARDSWAMRPGDSKKVDSEYVRKGTCSIFAFVEALAGKNIILAYVSTELRLTGLKKLNILLM